MLAPILATYCLLIESPSLIVADERCGIKTPVWRTLKATWAYFAVGTALYVFTRSMFSDSWTPGGNYSGLQYLNTQAWVIWIYLKTFVVPTGLTADTDLEVIREFFAPKVIWGIIVIATLLIIGLIAARQRKTLPISFGIFWFFIALVPSSSVIPLAEVMNHHRTFFPYIGLTMATGWCVFLVCSGVSESRKHKYAKIILPLLISGAIFAHAWGTFQRNEVWDSGESLWRDVTIKSPNNGRGLMNYGLALMGKGDIEGALEYYQRARNTNYGRHPYLFINMGIATANLAKKMNSEELRKQAEAYFQTALRYGPGFPQTHYRYARWLYSNGKNEAALQSVNRAIELAPANRAALDLKNRIIESEEEQIERLRSEAEIENTPQAFLQLSLEYYKLGRYRDCINSAESALKLRPDYALAYNNICSAHNQLGEYDLAIKTCQKALEIDPDFTRARNNLNHARKLKGLNQ
jgi:tetratricopeptide (TPR) repeat protein